MYWLCIILRTEQEEFNFSQSYNVKRFNILVIKKYISAEYRKKVIQLQQRFSIKNSEYL